MSTTTHGTAAASWGEYVDAVEAAALALREQVSCGARPGVPVIPQPVGPAPDSLQERREAVVALVLEVEALVARRQAEITQKLAGTSRPSGHQDGGYRQFGGSLDVLG